MRGVGDDLGPAHALLRGRGAGDHRDGRGGDHGARPQRVERDSPVAELLGHAQRDEAHADLRQRVGDVPAVPLRVERRRRRQRQHVRVAAGVRGRDQVRDAGARRDERPPRVDPHHQVEALRGRLQRAGEADRARVVDEDVDAAEARDGRRDRRLDGRLVAQVAGDRQRLPAGGLDGARRVVDGAGELRVRRVGLADERDVGAVPRRAHRDREADAARGPGDEQRAAGERSRGRHRGSPVNRRSARGASRRTRRRPRRTRRWRRSSRTRPPRP